MKMAVFAAQHQSVACDTLKVSLQSNQSIEVREIDLLCVIDTESCLDASVTFSPTPPHKNTEM